jgi:hypothetical protein
MSVVTLLNYKSVESRECSVCPCIPTPPHYTHTLTPTCTHTQSHSGATAMDESAADPTTVTQSTDTTNAHTQPTTTTPAPPTPTVTEVREAQRVYSALLDAVGVYLRAEAELSRNLMQGSSTTSTAAALSSSCVRAAAKGMDSEVGPAGAGGSPSAGATSTAQSAAAEEGPSDEEEGTHALRELCSGEEWAMLSRVFGETLQQFLQPHTVAPPVLFDSLL